MMVNGELMGLAQQVVQDQMDWIGETMKRLVPDVMYRKFMRGDLSHDKMNAWLRRNGISIIFNRTVPVVQVRVKDKVYAQFTPEIQIGERVVDLMKVLNSEKNPADIWRDN